MKMVTKLRIRADERGFLFREGALVEILQPGTRWMVDLFDRNRLEVVSVRETWIRLPEEDLRLIVRSGLLGREAKVVELSRHERAAIALDGTISALLGPGLAVAWNVLHDVEVTLFDTRKPWITVPQEDLLALVRSGLLDGQVEVIDLGQQERAIVSIDGRYDTVLGPGLSVAWTVFHQVKVVRFDARELWLDRPDLAAVLVTRGAAVQLSKVEVAPGWTALVFRDGEMVRRLAPGTYAYWKGVAEIVIVHLDLREQALELSGQEIMTADKVSLRLNSLVTYRVTDPERAVAVTEDVDRALYRQAQLALRAVVGTAELDRLLAAKDEVAEELLSEVRQSAAPLGVEILAFGIKDLILPGEMKELMNRVTEARKAAEAAVVTRREETAAMRSQANTARLLADNPTLMRMRELEVLEKVAERANLTVMLGDGDLSDRVVKML